MEETRDDAGPAEQGPSNASWWHSDFIERFGSVSLGSQDETLSNTESPRSSDQDVLSSQKASQILWRTGVLSEPIPNGFYSVVPEKRLKETFDDIPTLDELHVLRGEGFKADIILVDAAKDKKLSMLRQLIVALVKGLNSNPAAVIKKIAGLVSDFYKRPNLESPAKAALEETSHMFENRGLQLLGQIKHGSCRPRAILFKVLADTVGLESRLMVWLIYESVYFDQGLPSDGVVEYSDSYKHMSVIVELSSVEYLVDLMRFPGQLLPRTTKAIFMTHISAAGESDSAENDSCDSPLEPNSPLYGFSERVDPDSAEKDESLQLQRRLDSNVPGLSLRNMMLRSATSVDRKLSLSHSEPNIANSFWRRSRRKVIAEQRTASSSPEHPSFRARGRSMLSGDRKSFRDYADDMSTSSYRSDGASTSEARRIRRRSISITPEIGDDIVRKIMVGLEFRIYFAMGISMLVMINTSSLPEYYMLRQWQFILLGPFRAVRAMNETLKQNRLLREQGEDVSLDDRNRSSDLQNNEQISQKAISLPSYPHDYRRQISERSGHSGYLANDELVSTWNKVLQSSMFNNKPLLPYEEWNIDFSELTVGTRVGIGFFGEVFRGVWNGTDVAIKVFLEQHLTAENMEDFCNEISILRGLMCIHRMKVVHRDLKSANCLVNKHWTVKICDFGLSRIMTETPIKDSSSAGTPEWMAPELIRNEPYTEKCDIFSLGVIMWELCTLNRPWEGVPPERVVYAVANEGSRLEVPEGPLGRLISDCWAEPHQRPSCEEILTRLLDCEYTLC
ncbi:Serine/threonine-protein kinase [Morus notabilis]|uniref:Serine/threonine-protein kinase n=1 Tax=Morus notabilis TaxID=981085 RepID=W9SCZ1_9ROSA|nr:Serine/threonine-protein kinase [Morus notabilis]